MNGFVNWSMLEQLNTWAMNKSDEAAQHWNSTAASWQKRILFEHDFTKRQVGALTRITKDTTVLDACCGTGRLTIPIAQRAKHVYGVDGSENMLAYCHKNAEEAGLNNVTLKQLSNWHTSEPGAEIPIADIAVACISPAQADIVKFSRCATQYCYSLSFSKPIAYRHIMAELFDGVSPKWEEIMKKDKERNPIPQRALGINVPFNILYDLGGDPTIDYVDGGWEYEGESLDDVYTFLASLGEVPPEKYGRFIENCNKHMEKMENGRYRYVTRTQMYVLGWDPNTIKVETIAPQHGLTKQKL